MANITKNPTIEHDENIIAKIREMIEKGLDKLKFFLKSERKPNLDFYNELDDAFDEIISKLEYLELWEERRYFLPISRMILHIIYENSKDNNFGYCEFALELLDFFIELFEINTAFYTSKCNKEEFDLHRNICKQRYHDYRRIYYRNIYKPSGNYSEKELYEILKGLKE